MTLINLLALLFVLSSNMVNMSVVVSKEFLDQLSILWVLRIGIGFIMAIWSKMSALRPFKNFLAFLLLVAIDSKENQDSWMNLEA